jgi:ubiquinone/menaquinone biosynthesis C-methylase UbiE
MARHRAPGRRHDPYGNPADLRAFVRRQESPSRAVWQKPSVVMRALGIRRGQVVADIGAGPGYWTLRLARAVGPRGRVYAVEPAPAVIEVLRSRLTKARTRNVTPVLAHPDDPNLPPASCDLALIVNAYHHIGDRAGVLRRATRALKPGGRLVNIDWAEGESPVGPPARRRVPRAEFLRDARRAGLALATEHRLLPHQYFFVLRRAR